MPFFFFFFSQITIFFPSSEVHVLHLDNMQMNHHHGITWGKPCSLFIQLSLVKVQSAFPTMDFCSQSFRLSRGQKRTSPMETSSRKGISQGRLVLAPLPPLLSWRLRLALADRQCLGRVEKIPRCIEWIRDSELTWPPGGQTWA